MHLQHREPGNKGPKTHAVLLVHGSFFPASTAFDTELPGGSVLGQLAAAGFSAYTVDIRGYGGSTRPAFMSEPIGAYRPYATTEEAISDVAAAVDFVRTREHVKSVSLVGWSWGTTIVGGFAVRHPEQVDRLVLYGPSWLDAEPVPPTPVSSYRTLDKAAARARVLNGVPPERVEEINPSEWFELWWAQNLRFDPEGAKRTPAVVRAPSGVSQDYAEFWSRGKATWDPAKVRARTLVIVGEWDRNTPPKLSQQLVSKLTQAASRELVILPEGTHFMLLEKNRNVLIGNILGFLRKP